MTATVPTITTLQIDWTRCDGHGLCHALLPDQIALDEWGFPLVPRNAVPDAVLPDVRRVVAACPALALRLATTAVAAPTTATTGTSDVPA